MRQYFHYTYHLHTTQTICYLTNLVLCHYLPPPPPNLFIFVLAYNFCIKPSFMVKFKLQKASKIFQYYQPFTRGFELEKNKNVLIILVCLH